MSDSTLIYQAYGKEELVNQAIFSVISLLAKLPQRSDLKILIYTDKPELLGIFSNHPRIHIRKISMDDVKQWRGKIDFVHRVKIEILLDAIKQGCKNIFYCDGDTYFLKDPTTLFSMINGQTSIMHIPEASLALGRDPISKKMRKFVKTNKFKVSGKMISVGENTVMWNAGAIGLDASNTHLLQQVLELTDEMHSKYPKHVTEQLAVSYVLQTNTSIISADEEIYHYWNQKEEYQEIINKFLFENSKLEVAVDKIKNLEYPPRPLKKGGLLARLFSKLR